VKIKEANSVSSIIIFASRMFFLNNKNECKQHARFSTLRVSLLTWLCISANQILDMLLEQLNCNIFTENEDQSLTDVYISEKPQINF
jgi:MinD superfamily P-loop ATPase containing an inserted ferredoxin domain